MRIGGRESSFGKAFLFKKRFVDKDEHVDKGKVIYEKIRDKLEPAHKGEFVAIEVDTGDYLELSDTMEVGLADGAVKKELVFTDLTKLSEEAKKARITLTESKDALMGTKMFSAKRFDQTFLKFVAIDFEGKRVMVE